MTIRQGPALWVLLACGSVAAGTARALDPPHDASRSVDCGTCHITHHAADGAIAKIAGNPNLCLSCHTPGGVAGAKAYVDTDEAIPGVSGTSHRWDSGPAGWIKTNPANTSPGTLQSGGAFTGRYRTTYTMMITTAGNAGTARFAWTTSAPVSQTYRDEFPAIAYTGSNGTQSWSASPWEEIGESDGAAAGVIRVLAHAACAGGNCLRIGGGTIDSRGIRRAADVGGTTAAMLTFSYTRQLTLCPNTSTATVALQVSSDGTNWSTLATYNLNACDTAGVRQAFDVTAFIAATFQLRLLGSGTTGTNDFLYVDDVQIQGQAAGGGATDLVTGSNVALAQGLTVTFTNGTPSPSFRLNDQWTLYAAPDVNQPVSFALGARLASGKLVCSTCHNQHSQVAEPFDPTAPPYPTPGPGGAGRHFQRSDDDINQMCVDCHSARNVTATAQGSHPVGVTIPSTGFYRTR